MTKIVFLNWFNLIWNLNITKIEMNKKNIIITIITVIMIIIS